MILLVYCTSLDYSKVIVLILGPEKMKHDKQIQVYVIRWCPSQCSVDPIEEIILDNTYDPKDVIKKVIMILSLHCMG